MDKDILNEVIGAEKEIQQCIERERDRVREWIEAVKKESAEAVAGAEKSDGETLGRALEEARQEAQARAKRTVKDAEERAAGFENLDGAALKAIVMKRLPRILLE
jgi:vacuolar-type H+-ATPase subunit H